MPEKDVRLRLFIEAINRAGKQLNDVSQGLQRVGEKAAGVGTASKAAGTQGAQSMRRYERAILRLQTAFTKAKAAGDAMVGVGMQLGIVGAALTAAAVAPVKAAANFERSMSKVRAIAEPTREEFKMMGDEAKRLGRTTRYTAKEAAEGMQFLAMAGFSAAEVTAAIGPSLNLAAAGALELGEAADIASNILKAFNLEVKALVHVTDVLAKTAASSNTSVRQLAEAMKYVGPIAAAAGITVEETAAAIGVLGDAGIQGSMAGTQLRNIIIGLLAPTPKAQKVLADLNITIKRNADGTIDLADALKKLAKANLTAEQATDLFRRRAAAGGLVLSKNTERLIDLTEANYKAKDAALTMATVMEKNLGGALILLKSAFEGLMIALGEPLLKPLGDLVRKIAIVVGKMADWVAMHPKLSKTIISVTGLVGGFIVTLGAVLIPLGLLLKLVGSLGVTLVGTTGATVAQGAAFDAMGASAGKAAIGIRGLSGVMRTVPFAVIAAGIASVIRLFKELHKWGEELSELERAFKKEDAALALLNAKYREISEATGLNIRCTREFNKARKDGLIIMDQETKKWRLAKEGEAEALRKSREQAERLARLKKQQAIIDKEAAEEEKKQAKFREEAYRRMSAQAKRIRISLIEDEREKLTALQEFEIETFLATKDAKLMKEEQNQEMIQAIKAKYAVKLQDLNEKEIQAEGAKLQQILEENEQYAQEIADAQASWRAEAAREVETGMAPEDRMAAEYERRAEQIRAQGEAALIGEEEIQNRLDILHEQYINKRITREEAAAIAHKQLWSRMAGDVGDIFGNLYEMSGKRVKAFFYLQRAAAIAQAIIDTQLAIGRAAATTDPWTKYVHMAVAAAQGATRVAMITAQTIRGFAEGGRVLGRRGKDAIVARLTANEYVMPVEAVKHYGLGIMEAIRRRAIAIKKDAIPSFPIAQPAGAYQGGGRVTGGGEQTHETTIVNLTDPREIEAFLASARGQNAMINVISSNAPRVRRVLR